MMYNFCEEAMGLSEQTRTDRLCDSIFELRTGYEQYLFSYTSKPLKYVSEEGRVCDTLHTYTWIDAICYPRPLLFEHCQKTYSNINIKIRNILDKLISSSCSFKQDLQGEKTTSGVQDNLMRIFGVLLLQTKLRIWMINAIHSGHFEHQHICFKYLHDALVTLQ